MAKTPQRWRSEWDILRRKLLEEVDYHRTFITFSEDRNLFIIRAKQNVANAVLGYAMARGWYHV